MNSVKQRAAALASELASMKSREDQCSPSSPEGLKLQEEMAVKRSELDSLKALLAQNAPLALSRDGVPLTQVKHLSELKPDCWWFALIEQSIVVQHDPTGAIYSTGLPTAEKENYQNLREAPAPASEAASLLQPVKSYRRRAAKPENQNHHLVAVLEIETAKLRASKPPTPVVNALARTSTPSPLSKVTDADYEAYTAKLRAKFDEVDQFSVTVLPSANLVVGGNTEPVFSKPDRKPAPAPRDGTVFVAELPDDTIPQVIPATRPVPRVVKKKQPLGPTGFAAWADPVEAQPQQPQPPVPTEDETSGKRASPEQKNAPKQPARRQRRR